MCLEDGENDVYKKIVTETGFPKLKDFGGFELLHSVLNCKILERLKCSMSAKDLGSNVGQGKIYLRPRQKCLSVIPIRQQESNTIKKNVKYVMRNFYYRNLENI